MADIQLNKSITISQVQSDDYKMLASFLSEFLDDSRTKDEWLERLNYWWDANPSYNSDWIRGFVLKDAANIVGFVGSFPTDLLWEGKVVRAFNGTTWRVLPEYRKYSVDLWFENRKISKDYISFNTTPTEMLVKLIQRFKYREIPWGNKKESYILLSLNILKFKYINYCNHIFKTISFLQLKQFKRRNNVIIKEGIKQIEIEELWEKSSDRYSCTNVRSFKNVAWYSKGKRVFSLYSNMKFLGYFIILQSYSDGFKKMRIVDFWSEEITEIIVSSIVKYCHEIGKKENVDIVFFPYFNYKVEQILKKLLFLHKAINSFKHYYRIPHKLELKIETSKQYYVSLQGDFGA